MVQVQIDPATGAVDTPNDGGSSVPSDDAGNQQGDQEGENDHGEDHQHGNENDGHHDGGHEHEGNYDGGHEHEGNHDGENHADSASGHENAAFQPMFDGDVIALANSADSAGQNHSQGQDHNPTQDTSHDGSPIHFEDVFSDAGSGDGSLDGLLQFDNTPADAGGSQGQGVQTNGAETAPHADTVVNQPANGEPGHDATVPADTHSAGAVADAGHIMGPSDHAIDAANDLLNAGKHTNT
jgi:hypothetical protein